MKIGYDAKRIFHNNTGLGNYGRDIVRILNSYPEVAHFFLFNTKESGFKHKIPSDKATIIYPRGWFWKRFPSVWRSFGQWKQIKASKVDLYHGLSGELPVQVGTSKIPKIVTIHDLLFLSHPRFYHFFESVIYQLKARYAVNMADHIVAISKQTKADIVKYFKVKPEKITVIYQGCNDAFKQEYTESEKQKVQEKYKLPKHYVLNVGTIEQRKNALTLVKAINGTPYHLVLVGTQKKYAAKIHTYINQYGLENQVTFLSNIDLKTLAILYQSATVFCYPSICEGFGIPIIEALYSKTPVITTKGGCFREAGGPDSVYVAPQNENEMEQALNSLFKNPEKRKLMAENGFAYAQQFSDQNVGSSLLQFYKGVFNIHFYHRGSLGESRSKIGGWKW